MKGQRVGNWIIALVLFLIWLGRVIFGKSGFIHILLLCAIALALVQWIADHRARQAQEELARERDERGMMNAK